MKKLFSLILALLMIASAAAVAVSAEVIYEDDFEDEELNLYDWSTGEGFWFKNKDNGQPGLGKFEETGGTLNGFDDARFGFSMYWGDEENNLSYADAYPMFKEMTVWVDVKVDESGIEDAFSSGLMFEDTYDLNRGYQTETDMFHIAYYAIDNNDLVEKPLLDDDDQLQYDGDGNVILAPQPHTSFVRLSCSTPRRDKGGYKDLNEGSKSHNYVLGEYDIPGDPGFNINEDDPVKIGIRFGNGNITAYANGKIVATYDHETIGKTATPAAYLCNTGCYVEYDNYGVGTYDHDVKKMTRTDSYELYEGTVTVMDGETVAGTVNAAEDDELTVTAPKVAGRKFVRWESVSIDGVEVKDVAKTELLYGIKIGSLEDEKFTITMPDADVVLKAVYEDSEGDDFIPGDANNDGKVNAKDVTAIMKYIVGVTAKDFNESAADFDANGKINAKDVSAVMKYIVTNA